MKKRVHKQIKSALTIWVACVLYMTGLAFLVPLISLILFPPDFFITPTNLGTLTCIAIALVIISALILKQYKKSTGSTIHYLSYMTLAVGIIAVAFTVIGKQKLLTTASELGRLEPVAAGYIDYWAYFIPKAGISIAIYLVIAIIFWIIGARIKQKEYARGWVKKHTAKKPE